MKPSNSISHPIIARSLHITGRVQGVGFRPFIYRLANIHGLKGFVLNRPDGVLVHIEGNKNTCKLFVADIHVQKPSASIVKEIQVSDVTPQNFDDFKILPSDKNETCITEICPDIAICPDCIEELYTNNRRKQYPLINCTNCGPRFTLVNDFPYDRANTSMHEFEMCPDCKTEYENPRNRRFHAQPTSCYACGPHYEFHFHSSVVDDSQKIIRFIATNISKGKVVALKGLGGYNLCCDACNPQAVEEIRNFKKRERKPFAILCRSVEATRKIAHLNQSEELALASWQRPIMVVKQKHNKLLDKGVNIGLLSIGIFLPYLPLHHLIFNKLKTNYLVLTSGNESDTPILYREAEALETFSDISGGILINNRKILRRVDDSVVKIIDSKPRLMRRARGYTPSPVDLSFDATGILATGAELSNAFCMGKCNQAIFSQHIGDLKNVETYNFFTENIEQFSRMFRFQPKHIVCDLHPDYLSTQYAVNSGLPVIQVQHHHAHIASVMAEYGINETVIGLAWDGTGYGTDDHIWGSETLIADYSDFQRISHFDYIPLPGGDKVTHEPWRTALVYLYKTFGNEWKKQSIPFVQLIDNSKAQLLIQAIDKNINAPLSSGAGRLFDAVAALTGICLESNYHAEAPQRLEDLTTSEITDSYSFEGDSSISFTPMIRDIVDDLKSELSLNKIITKFHNTLAQVALKQVVLASEQTASRKVVLSGGTFQNKYLSEKIVFLLLQNGFEVFFPKEISCNDGGIALGQLAIAAHKTKK